MKRPNGLGRHAGSGPPTLCRQRPQQRVQRPPLIPRQHRRCPPDRRRVQAAAPGPRARPLGVNPAMHDRRSTDDSRRLDRAPSLFEPIDQERHPAARHEHVPLELPQRNRPFGQQRFQEVQLRETQPVSGRHGRSLRAQRRMRPCQIHPEVLCSGEPVSAVPRRRLAAVPRAVTLPPVYATRTPPPPASAWVTHRGDDPRRGCVQHRPIRHLLHPLNGSGISNPLPTVRGMRWT